MADKKSLFAGRTGDKSSKFSVSPKKRGGATTPPKMGSGNLSPAPPGSGEKKRPLSFGKSGAGRGLAMALRRETQAKEADDYRKQANKMLTKTMTRWNPDFFSAAPLFEKAGACYRAAGEDGKATAMYMQAGDCHCHDSVMAHASAAKDFREAALITERQGRKDEAAALYLRCAEAWVHADEPGRAADYFGRSAKLVKDSDEEAAAERYIFASKIMVPKGSDTRSNFTRVVGGVDILVQAITYLATVNRLEESLQVVNRYIIILRAEGMEHSLGRMYLTYCVLALALGDYVRADAAFRDEHLQNTAYLRSEECRVEEDLLTAFKDCRPDLLRQAQNDRTLRRLETAIVRIAKALTVPGDEEDDYDADAIPARETPSGTIGAARARAQALKEKHGLAAPAKATEDARKATPPPPPVDGSGGGVAGGAAKSPPTPPPRPTVTSSSLSSSTPSSSAFPGHPDDHKTTSEGNPTPANDGGGSDDPARDALFGSPRRPKRASSPPPPPPPSSHLPAATTSVGPTTRGSSVEAAAAGRADGAAVESLEVNFPESSLVPGPDEAEVDLGLGDLEASLGMLGDSGGGGDGEDDDDLDAMIEAARREAEALALGGSGEESDEEEEEIDLT